MREDRVRVVPLPVHEMVYGALQSLAHGLEEHGDEPRGEDRDQEVSLDPKHGPYAAHHQHVDPDDARGEGGVDDGSVDDEVYVEEPVAQDSDADG